MVFLFRPNRESRIAFFLAKLPIKRIVHPNIDKDRFHLQIAKSRLISDLKWMISTTDKEEILSPTDVQIKIHSVGLNFRNVLKVRGLFPHIEEFGIEYHEQHANTRD
ncbi:unnamed protein product [Didymodactylos carnosus]|uniref:Uncharacterized protein n=1 Tax=Didymodactylos carnosus TaxID=1234261 RepID=A0A815BG56_9BILA|nr:unnamed protein product [Didymodactylos carnosus]CAF4055312.1 unnamed protein product [Didymodactylos carnosus]